MDAATAEAEIQNLHNRARRQARKRQSTIPALVFDIVAQQARLLGRVPHFVQVGAHDGQMDDPMYDRVIAGDWHGLLLEPSPYYFARLEALHRDRPQVVTLNLGVAEVPGRMALYRINPAVQSLYAAWIAGCASLNREQVAGVMRKQPHFDERHVISDTVALKPLRDILAEAGISLTDGLLVDVEGFEAQVFRSFDLRRLRPSFVLYEHKHLSPDARAEIDAMLAEAGYRLFGLRKDVLALSDGLTGPGIAAALQALGAQIVP